MQVNLGHQSNPNQVKKNVLNELVSNSVFESVLKPKEIKEEAPLSVLVLDMQRIEDIVGVSQKSENFLQNLELLACAYPFETREYTSKIEPLNPFSYPRTLVVLENLMEEKIKELHAQRQDSKDSTLQILLFFKEKFLEFPSFMDSLKQDATSASDVFAMFSPTNLEKDKDGIYLQKAKELQESIATLVSGVESGVAWIKGFFGAIKENLNPFENKLVSEHLAVFQAYWKEQTDSKNKGIVLNNGMAYREYRDFNDVIGFNLIMDDRIFAYREKLLKDDSIEAVLAIFDKSTESKNTVSLASLSGEMMQSFKEIEKMGYRAVGIKSKIL